MTEASDFLHLPRDEKSIQPMVVSYSIHLSHGYQKNDAVVPLPQSYFRIVPSGGPTRQV